MDYLIENHDKLLYVIGGISLVLELTIMGLSGPLLFFALGCVLSGFLVSFGLLTTWEYEVLSVGLLTIFSALVLWKPLKKLQGEGKKFDTSSDMIGQIVTVSLPVTGSEGAIRYSGINWQAKLHPEAKLATVEEGMQVEIIAVDGTVMLVKELTK